MRTLRFGSNFALFVGFFGIAMLDAIREADWVRGLFWTVIAAIFLWGDRRQER